jgi:tRNA(Arg) A34 adenosine deaminase TadA
MRGAIEVARRNPDAPFGAVTVGDSGQRSSRRVSTRVRGTSVWHDDLAAIMGCAETSQWRGLVADDPIHDRRALPRPMCSPAILWVGIPRVAYGTYAEILNGLGFPKLDLSRPKISHRNSPDEPEVIGAG